MAPLDQNAKDKVELGTQRLPILLPGLLVTKGTMCDKELTDGGFYSIDLKKKCLLVQRLDQSMVMGKVQERGAQQSCLWGPFILGLLGLNRFLG